LVGLGGLVLDGVRVAGSVLDGGGVADGGGVRDGGNVAVGVPLGSGVSVGVSVGCGVSVGVRVRDGVSVCVGTGVSLGVLVIVEVGIDIVGGTTTCCGLRLAGTAITLVINPTMHRHINRVSTRNITVTVLKMPSEPRFIDAPFEQPPVLRIALSQDRPFGNFSIRAVL
jgi:hypothetical protein